MSAFERGGVGPALLLGMGIVEGGFEAVDVII
jgi:hypothetical protein